MAHLESVGLPFNTDFRDHVWAQIVLTGKRSLLCGRISRRPAKDKDASEFNYREIDWANESANEQSEHLLTFAGPNIK